jgi:hypothetical protein
MGPMYTKVLQAVRQQGPAGDELWAQLDMADQTMHHAGRRTGPVWKGLVAHVCEAQGGVELSLGSEMVWAWTPETPLLEVPLSWLNIMRSGVAQTDVTMRMVWEEKIGDKQISRIKGRIRGGHGAEDRPGVDEPRL